MNCRPGDLAVVVNDPDCNQVNLGFVVRVLRLSDLVEGEWVCEDGGKMKAAVEGYDPSQSHLIDLPDAWLRPIRPGDISDSEVEELYRAPSLPVKEQA